MVKNPPAKQETWVRSWGWEEPLEKEIATHSSILAWEIPLKKEPGGYSAWNHKERDTTERLNSNNRECHLLVSLVTQMVKNLPAMQETQV